MNDKIIDHYECIYFLDDIENSCLLFQVENVDEVFAYISQKDVDMSLVSDEDVENDFKMCSNMTKRERVKCIRGDICPRFKDNI